MLFSLSHVAHTDNGQSPASWHPFIHARRLQQASSKATAMITVTRNDNSEVHSADSGHVPSTGPMVQSTP